MRVLRDVQEVAVIQRLQAKVIKLQIALRLQRRTQAFQVKLLQFFIQQLGIHPAS
jgi:hypothetical protein